MYLKKYAYINLLKHLFDLNIQTLVIRNVRHWHDTAQKQLGYMQVAVCNQEMSNSSCYHQQKNNYY